MKILITDLSHLTHNFGVQALLLPFISKLSEYFTVNVTVVTSNPSYYRVDKVYAKQNGFDLFLRPRLSFLSVIKPKNFFLILEYYKLIKSHDIIIDLNGIEFVGNITNSLKWKNLGNTLLTQILADKAKKKYYKYTKSFGPIHGCLYKSIVQSSLNKLPFLFVRGKQNLESINKLNLKIPTYSFPDISLILEASEKKWALEYLKQYFESPIKIIGVSPSIVLSNLKSNQKNICGSRYVRLIKQILSFFISNNFSVLLIPHSIDDGVNLKSCDLALSKGIFKDIKENNLINLLDDQDLTYKQVRSIIGCLDFYITSRYHSLTSAMKMKVPTVSLSWHIKYRDLLSMYLKEFPIIDCQKITIPEALKVVEKYFGDRSWFNEMALAKKQQKIEKQVDRSIKLIVNHITEDINDK